MPDFWHVRRKNFRHQRRLPCHRQIFVGAPQLPVPGTFSSTVRVSSWVPCTFSSAALARSQALSAPFLQRCRPHVGFFGCLSYGHVEVSRNSFLRQHLKTAANLSSALPFFSFSSFYCNFSFHLCSLALV